MQSKTNHKTGMGSHHSEKMKNDEWLTPPELHAKLGRFDLDPCAPITRPWPTADNHYTITDNGMSKEWFGRVWLNPPYGREAAQWLNRMADHGNGLALVFARTETDMFFKQVWERATAILFIRGRISFHYVDGRKAKANGGAPSCLIAYGNKEAVFLENCTLPGQFVSLREVRDAV